MKILYTLDSGQPGGMEYHTLDLVKGMISKGHQVYVWCQEGPLAEMFKKTGAFVRTKSLAFDIDPTYIVQLLNFVKQESIDVIHAHELRAVTNSVLGGKLGGAQALVTHIHTPLSHWPISSKKKKIYTYFYSKLINLFASREIALTSTIKKIKLSEGIKENQLAVIPNAFQTEKFDLNKYDKNASKEEMSIKYGFPKEKFIFGNTSRLSENKGTHEILYAYKNLLDTNRISTEDTHLLFAGKGEQLDNAKSLAESLNIAENVTFTGTFPDEDHVKLYNSIDAFVFATHSEGFGLVLVEAMALQIPVICSDLPVLHDVGRDFVFDYFENDVESLAAAMTDLYENFSEAQELALKAKDFVRSEYSMKSFIENYENLYSGLLKESV